MAMEHDQRMWFKNAALAGRGLILTWCASSYFLNLAFNSNLRAVLLRPQTEQPIESFHDAVFRGEHVWIGHFLPDPSKPDNIHQYFMNARALPSVKEYIEAKNMDTYEYAYFHAIPDHVLKDINENGASILLPPYYGYNLQVIKY